MSAQEELPSQVGCNFLSFDIVATVCNDQIFVTSRNSPLRISALQRAVIKLTIVISYKHFTVYSGNY